MHILPVLKKRPKTELNSSQSDTCSERSLGRSHDINLIIIHKINFKWHFSIFLDAKCISDIAEPKKLKNLIRPIFVLLWSRMPQPKQDHKRTSSGPSVRAGFPQQNINQTKTRIGNKKLLVELYACNKPYIPILINVQKISICKTWLSARLSCLD